MSTGVDSRGYSGISSHQNSASNPRRRSPSLPTLDDSSEIHSRHSNSFGISSGGRSSVIMTQSQRSRFFRTGVIVTALVLLIFYLSPSRISIKDQPLNSPFSASGKCTRPYDPSKPLIQYALMIDAGSTGSRIHVYRFNNCGPSPELEHEEFKMTEKKKGGSGLSSYKDDAEGSAKSLDVLMDVAMDTVPDEYKACSPVAVKATAGLRMLGSEMSEKILEAVRHRLETVYPFPVVSKEKGGVEIMDGKDEGVYAWITTNYLLGKIGGPDVNPTAAIFDLGGGSTQIVFQPTFDSKSGGMPDKLAEGDHKYELQFGDRKFELYQHSHLGYGLMAAREALHKAILGAKLAESPDDLSWLKRPIVNPCIGPGMERQVNLTFPDDHPLGQEVSVQMTGPKETSAAAQCRGLAEKILHKDSDCNLAPCSFNGVHQPSLEKTFSKEDVYIFSYFYDRTKPLGMPESFTLEELQKLAQSVCAGESSWGVFEGIVGALESLRDRPEWCLDLNFMMALLHTGYDMPLSREVKIAKKIKGNELGWCLGASLPLLNQASGWTCRINEVS
ncbi:nucleoside diphosphatase Gda1 [Elaphomyces granulatus]